MQIRRWIIVPRGQVDKGRTLAKKTGIGEIEERDGDFAPHIAEEQVPDMIDWQEKMKSAKTDREKLAILAQYLGLET